MLNACPIVSFTESVSPVIWFTISSSRVASFCFSHFAYPCFFCVAAKKSLAFWALMPKSVSPLSTAFPNSPNVPPMWSKKSSGRIIPSRIMRHSALLFKALFFRSPAAIISSSTFFAVCSRLAFRPSMKMVLLSSIKCWKWSMMSCTSRKSLVGMSASVYSPRRFSSSISLSSMSGSYRSAAWLSLDALPSAMAAYAAAISAMSFWANAPWFKNIWQSRATGVLSSSGTCFASTLLRSAVSRLRTPLRMVYRSPAFFRASSLSARYCSSFLLYSALICFRSLALCRATTSFNGFAASKFSNFLSIRSICSPKIAARFRSFSISAL